MHSRVSQLLFMITALYCSSSTTWASASRASLGSWEEIDHHTEATPPMVLVLKSFTDAAIQTDPTPPHFSTVMASLLYKIPAKIYAKIPAHWPTGDKAEVIADTVFGISMAGFFLLTITNPPPQICR